MTDDNAGRVAAPSAGEAPRPYRLRLRELRLEGAGAWPGAAAIAFLALYAAGLAAGFQDALTILPYHAPALVTLALLPRAIRRAVGRERLGLWLLGGTIVSWDAADWVFSFSQLVHGRDPGFPGIADGFYYAGYVFAAGAVPLLAVASRQRLDIRWVLDAAISMVVTAALAWQFLIMPHAGAAGPGHFEAAVAIGYPVLDLGLLMVVMSAFYSAGGRLSPRAALLSFGLLLFVATDAAFAAQLLSTHEAVYTPWLDLGWLGTNCAMAVAVALPASEGPAEARQPAMFGTLMPYALAMPLIGVLLGIAAFQPDAHLVLSLGAVCALLLLALRQRITLSDNRALTASLAAQAESQAVLMHALHESEHFSRTVIAMLGESLVVFDRELRFVLANQRFELVTGMRADDLCGRRFADCFPWLAEHGIEALLHRALAGEVVSVEDVPYQSAITGGPGWFSARFGPLKAMDGTVTGAIAAVHDVTEQRLAQQSLNQAEKMDGLAVLAGGIAHDFNNLLTTILGSCALMELDAGHGDDTRELIDTVRTAAHRGAAISERLLGFARGGLASFEPIDLRDVANEAVRLVRGALPAGVHVALNASPFPAWVQGDRSQLLRVVLNLVMNARDAVGDAGHVRLTVATAGTTATLAVADDGPGIDEATRLRIFEPFFTTKQPGAGTGLGLAVAYTVMQQHRGSVTVETSIAGGAQFVLTLPLVEAPQLAAAGG